MTRLQYSRLLALAGAGLVCLFGTGASMAQVSPSICGSMAGFGPYDYRTERGNPLRLVESAHFTPKVEALIAGNTSETPYLDLDYTLRAFPNHHRALVSVLRWSERAKSLQPRSFNRPAECYFDNAVRWRPDDPVARMLYAQFLYLWKRPAEAEAQLQQAVRVAGDNPMTQYNIGLVFLEGGNPTNALAQAHKAYAMGYTRTELRDRLKQSGHWREADPPTSPEPAASAAQPAASGAER